MTRCGGHGSEHCTGEAIGLFRWDAFADSRPLCRECKAGLERVGMWLSEDVTSWRARAVAKALPGWVRVA